MPMRVTQNSFVAGELAPELFGRQDLKKYFEGAAKLRNMVVQRTGGVTKRQGTDLLDSLTSVTGWGGNTQGCRLVPFMLDGTTAFVVVLAHLKAYFYRNGLPVLADGSTVIYSIDTPFDYETLVGLRFFQSGDTIFFTHKDIRPSKLVHWGDSDWRLSFLTFDIEVAAPTGITINSFNGAGTVVATSAAATSTQHSYCVSAVVDGVESRPSEIVSWGVPSVWPAGQYVQLVWNEVAGATNYRVYKKSYGSFGFIGNSPVASNTGLAYTATLSSECSIVPGYVGNDIANLNDGVVNDETGDPAHNASYCVFKANPAARTVYQFINFDLGSAQAVSGMRMAVGAIVLGTTGGVSTIGGGLGAIRIRRSADGVTWTTVKDFVYSSLEGVSDGFIPLIWPSKTFQYWQIAGFPSGIGRDEGGYYPPDVPVVIREVQWFSSGIPEVFRDSNIDQDGADSPTDAADPWTDDTGYPSVMTLFQQRSVWAGSEALPTQVLMSTIGNLYCFNASTPLKPEDKIDVRLPVIRPGAIKHMVPLRQLLLLTESSEWVVTFDETKGLAYDTMRMHQNSFFGCCGIEPLTIGNSVLFIDRMARSVLEYQYQLANDGFSAQDRTILSNHLTASARIVSWCYQKGPQSVVWCAMDDGTLIAMTYLPEHEIWAWSRHDLADGKVLDVVAAGASVDYLGTDTNTSDVYLLVERGDDVYLERMRTVPQVDSPRCGQAVCMDMVQRIELGAAQSSFAIPATHTAIPDGAYTVVDLETGAAQTADVSAGVVSVAAAVRYMVLGKAITSQIETLRPEGQQFSIQGARQSVKGITLRLYRSGGGTAGALGARTSEIALPDSTPTVLLSPEGDPDCTVNLVCADARLAMPGMFSRNGQTSITHTSHWPFSVLSLATEIETEGGR